MKVVKAAVPVDVPLTQEQLDQAVERGEARHDAGLQVSTLSYAAGCLCLGFADGSSIHLPVDNYPELAALSDTQLQQLQLGFSATAVCHEALDLQVSMVGLLSASEPLMKLATQLVASRNGRQSSAAKARAARLNGKKGGRPRKVEVPA
ncbi:DUF2442 domain-containing protein [Pseudomonas protegens]|uniref:DUF2442 domain-containing protein n=1 Tax=Pseudomonas protegens TaxID=380021 RepID=UPI000E1F787E|nr:DUF2442 domain-containing protein [Pseudomonas protegens]AXK53957.1 DUF2442 domain-containing protein [Pseudomonas protegens]